MSHTTIQLRVCKRLHIITCMQKTTVFPHIITWTGPLVLQPQSDPVYYSSMVQYLSRVRTCFQPGQNTVEYSSSLHTVSYSAQLKLNDQLVMVSKIKPDMLYDLSTIYYCTAINFCTRLHYATFDGLESRMSVVANTVSDLRSGYASGHAHMPSTHSELHGMHACTKRTLQSARQLRTFRYICK